MKNVLILNDNNELNKRYRSELINNLILDNYKVKYLSLNNKFECLFEILKFKKNTPIISSNLRSNILSLMMPWLSGIVILNGLGRYRKKRIFRLALLSLIIINKKKIITVQSYADYRYIHKLCTNNQKIQWIPGSGGKHKAIGKRENLVLIQRDDKIDLVIDSIQKLLTYYSTNKTQVNIIGCNNNEKIMKLFSGTNYKSYGFVPSEEIFISGSIFIQPSGYGEGFPHSLADAICSKMEILIDNKEYIKYGLWKIGGNRVPITKSWSKLIITKDLVNSIQTSTITQKYIDNFNESQNK